MTDDNKFRRANHAAQHAAIGLDASGTRLLHEHFYEDGDRAADRAAARLRAFTPSRCAFRPLPRPKDGDWLSDIPSRFRIQSFAAFARKAKRRPISGGRDSIFLLPLTEGVPHEDRLKRFPSFAAVRDMVAAFFSVPVELLPVQRLSALSSAITSRRVEDDEGDGHHRQYHAGHILKSLRAVRRRHRRCMTLMAFTMADLYKGGFNYLFGLGSGAGGVGVFSFNRQDPASPNCDAWNGTTSRQPGDNYVLLRRASATLCHEIGHTLGLPHCCLYRCLMQGANSLAEAEGRGHALCPCCLRKLTWAVRSEPLARYSALESHFLRHSFAFADALQWVERRIEETRDLVPAASVSLFAAHGQLEEHKQQEEQRANKSSIADYKPRGKKVVVPCKVVATNGVIVRAGWDKSSARQRVVPCGDTVAALTPANTCHTPRGTERLEIKGGWITSKNRAGTRLVEDPPVAPQTRGHRAPEASVLVWRR